VLAAGWLGVALKLRMRAPALLISTTLAGSADAQRCAHLLLDTFGGACAAQAEARAAADNAELPFIVGMIPKP
jgi:hypothetical protein